jgi:hypothetical protein
MPEPLEKPTPPCPVCAGMSELKQILRREHEYHCFFRCVVCTVIFPVVEPIARARPEPGG